MPKTDKKLEFSIKLYSKKVETDLWFTGKQSEDDIENAYKEMAKDTKREEEAKQWEQLGVKSLSNE